MEEMEEQRDVLIVRNMKPPFLDGDVHFTRQTEMVSTVKDPTSDFAKLARSGSAVLKAFILRCINNEEAGAQMEGSDNDTL